MWCFLPLACVLCLWASCTPGTHMWAVHHTQECYLPCVPLERGLKHCLQCTASKTAPFSFKAWNQSKTSRRSTRMVPPEICMHTTNSLSRKCQAASFTTRFSVKETEPFPTNTYDTDNNLKLEIDEMTDFVTLWLLVQLATKAGLLTCLQVFWLWPLPCSVEESIIHHRQSCQQSQLAAPVIVIMQVYFCAIMYPAALSNSQQNDLIVELCLEKSGQLLFS